MSVFVKASRRAKAYTRRDAIKGSGFPDHARAHSVKGFPEMIRKGGKVYSRHRFSANRTKLEKYLKEDRSHGAKAIMRGNKNGFAIYTTTDYLTSKYK